MSCRKLLPLFAALVALAACGGPRQPPAKPGQTLFWRVTSSDVTFTQCSDDPAFRKDTVPIAFDENTYVIYRMEADGKKATALKCTKLDVSTCEDSTTGVVFDVAGNELLFSKETKSPIGTAGCQLNGAQSWVLTDQGETLSMEVTNVLSLVDNQAACDTIEAQIKDQSPNKTGLQGCIVKFTVGASIR
jgi:hypothetical protein